MRRIVSPRLGVLFLIILLCSASAQAEVWVQHTKKDFAAGTGEDVELELVPDSIILAKTAEYSEDFSSQSALTNWTQPYNNWKIDGGKLVFQHSAYYGDSVKLNLPQSNTWKDYIYEVDVTILAKGSQPNWLGPFLRDKVQLLMYSTSLSIMGNGLSSTKLGDYNFEVGDTYRFRIVANGPTVTVYVNGQFVASITDQRLDIPGTVGFLQAGGYNCAIDNVRIYEAYATAGNYFSSIYDAGYTAEWKSFEWNYTRPEGTDLSLQVRTGSTAQYSQGTWSSWSAPVYATGNSASIDVPAGRYVQYRLQLFTSSGQITPCVNYLALNYTGSLLFSLDELDFGEVTIGTPKVIKGDLSLAGVDEGSNIKIQCGGLALGPHSVPVKISPSVIAGLNPGQVQELSFTLELPVGAIPGLYTGECLIFADANGNDLWDQVELGLSVPIKALVQATELALSQEKLDFILQPGSTETRSISLRNLGAETLAGLKAEIQPLVSPSDDLLQASFLTIDALPEVILGSGEATVQVAVSVPQGQPLGMYEGPVLFYSDTNQNGIYDSGELAVLLLICVNVSVTPLPIKPIGSAAMENNVTLSWHRVEGVQKYIIKLGRTPTFTDNYLELFEVAQQESSIIEYTFARPLSEGLWYWQIIANDENSGSKVESFVVKASLTNTLGLDNVIVAPAHFNPRREQTTVCYLLSSNVELASSARVTIKIYNLEGKLVRTLCENQERSLGANFVDVWDGKDNRGRLVPSGPYLVLVTAENEASTMLAKGRGLVFATNL
jgi:hypothetical protein